jgi:hypothetical protein
MFKHWASNMTALHRRQTPVKIGEENIIEELLA